MNLVQRAVSAGGKLAPIVIPNEVTSGTGLMNPSVFVDDDGDILVNLRHTNYTLIHSENNQMFPSIWGPLAYAHPEKDPKLGTTNYLVRMTGDLKVADYCLVDTSKNDISPVWEFVGLEDARLVKWGKKYYLCGVRRDVIPKNNDPISGEPRWGEGRMELVEIKINKTKWSAKEISRIRIPAPGEDSSYCEKNWYPIIDKAYHFIKWTSPTELVKTYPTLPARCEQVSVKEGLKVESDLRGGSQAIPWGKYYISISHEVDLFTNYLSQKDGIYRHRLCVWDKDMTLIGLSPKRFSFLDARIEFCAGAAKYKDDLLISFGFQDNAAFILKVTNDLVEEMIEEALSYEFN